mgnify:CR=1 FL=1
MNMQWTVDNSEDAEESWQQVAKRRKAEKREEVTLLREEKNDSTFL